MSDNLVEVNITKDGMSRFSEMTFQEFKEWYLSDLQPVVKALNQTRTVTLKELRRLNIPNKLDWRTHLNYSIISPVKNQKKCGGCWAFSTVETVESMYAKATGQPPPDLSVQQVIDCAADNEGCSGGDTCTALRWMVNSGTPLMTNAEYPLTDESNLCKTRPSSSVGVKVKHYSCFSNNESLILQLLQNGPVVAAVDATTWNNYQGGIIQYHCESRLNHAVQIVGYDLTGEVPFYIVRNSWGTDFGHDGYLYIKIGVNMCGIGTEISIVTVDV